MTNFASKYNKGSLFTTKLSGKGTYTTLKELFNENGTDKSYLVLNLYINTKGRFGDNPVVLTEDDLLVNLPSHLLETVKEMRQDEDFINACNNHEVAFSIYQYTNANGSGFSINWLDVESDLPF